MTNQARFEVKLKQYRKPVECYLCDKPIITIVQIDIRPVQMVQRRRQPERWLFCPACASNLNKQIDEVVVNILKINL